jgi:hypothetical protein
MHLAEPRISSGIPLSGADMISFSTVAADSARSAAVSARDKVEITRTKNTTRRDRMGFLDDDCNVSSWLRREMLKNFEGLDTVTLVTVPNPRLPGSVVGGKSIYAGVKASK